MKFRQQKKRLNLRIGGKYRAIYNRSEVEGGIMEFWGTHDVIIISPRNMSAQPEYKWRAKLLNRPDSVNLAFKEVDFLNEI